jgi:hypothetical protein
MWVIAKDLADNGVDEWAANALGGSEKVSLGAGGYLSQLMTHSTGVINLIKDSSIVGSGVLTELVDALDTEDGGSGDWEARAELLGELVMEQIKTLVTDTSTDIDGEGQTKMQCVLTEALSPALTSVPMEKMKALLRSSVEQLLVVWEAFKDTIEAKVDELLLKVADAIIGSETRDTIEKWLVFAAAARCKAQTGLLTLASKPGFLNSTFCLAGKMWAKGNDFFSGHRRWPLRRTLRRSRRWTSPSTGSTKRSSPPSTLS